MKSRYVFLLCILLLGASILAASPADNARLVNAVKNRDLPAVRTLLKQHVDPNAPDVDGTTPLIWAAHNGDSETGKRLISAGANVKMLSDFDHTTIRDYIYERLTATRRRELHARAASWYDASGNGPEARYHEQLAGPTSRRTGPRNGPRNGSAPR